MVSLLRTEVAKTLVSSELVSLFLLGSFFQATVYQFKKIIKFITSITYFLLYVCKLRVWEGSENLGRFNEMKAKFNF